MNIGGLIKGLLALRVPRFGDDANGPFLVDLSGANAYGYAALPRDSGGYAIGNLIPRQNTLANLLGIAGGNGEISKATDWHALVRHTGVVNGAKVLYSERKRAGAQAFVAQSIPNAAVTALSFGGALATADSTLWNSANPTRFLIPVGANRCRCTSRVRFAANATGTRKLSVMDSTGNTLIDLNQAPAHGTLPTEILVSSQVFNPGTGAYMEIKALQDSGAALNTDSTPFAIAEFEFWVE